MGNSVGKLVGYLFVGCILSLIAIMLALPIQVVTKTIDKEELLIRNSLGDAAADEVINKADRWFTAIFVTTGFQEATYDVLTPTERQIKQDKKMSDLGSSIFTVFKVRLNTIYKMIYLGIVRTVMLLEWLPVLGPILLAAAYDGYMRRKVKMLTFRQLSAPFYGIAQHALAIVSLLPLFYLIFPLTISPTAMPIVVILAALLMRMFVSNIQRM
jgi:hypothetical protein